MIGLDGNAFFLLGAFARAARREGWSEAEISAVRDEATSGNYEHLLRTLMKYTEDEGVGAVSGSEVTREGEGILTIAPYKEDGRWVFDDVALGLIKEPFVSGADSIIEVLAIGIRDANAGFELRFSRSNFPGAQLELTLGKEQDGGHWYRSERLCMEGWLCPALMKYYTEPPPRLYVAAGPLKAKG